MGLIEKIETREGVVSVIGLGYVGLPLALAFAEAGFRVVGIDVDRNKVEAVNRGESYIQDIPSENLAKYTRGSGDAGKPAGGGAGDPGFLPVLGRTEGRSKAAEPHLRATTDFDVLKQVDAAIICVPTPLGKTKDPDVSYIIAAADAIAKRLHPGMLVVLESTTYPGTTTELVLPRLQSANGQRWDVGKDFYLAFSPERIDPGRTDYSVRTTPKVIGGVTAECLGAAQALYRTAIDRVVPVSSTEAAEMVKLLENTFRAVNIGLVNEMAIMCDRLHLDVWEIIEAAKTKPYGFMPFYPGPGLGGHCIPIDPEYLAWKLKTLDYNARFIQLASEINFGMPHYVLGKIVHALNRERKALNGSQVLVLGVTYKADIGDLRESPALDLLHLLSEEGAQVEYHDPYVPALRIDGLRMESVNLDEHVLGGADCVVIATAHSSYDWAWVAAHSRLMVDTRNALKGIPLGQARVVKL